MRRELLHPRRRGARVLATLAVSLSFAAGAQEEGTAADAGLTGAVQQVLAAAEAAVEERELQIAESHYRTALRQGWLRLGTLEVAAGDLTAARQAFEEATRATAAGTRVARVAVALVQIHTGELERSTRALESLAAEKPGDLQTRIHLVHALVLDGRTEHAGRELEDLRPRIPEAVAQLERNLAETEDDPEARREAFLPRLNVGRLGELSPSELGALRARLRATQGQIYRNLGVLLDRTGRPGRAAEQVAQADEIAPPHPPGAAEAVASGLVDLRQTPPGAAVEPLAADEETLWKTATVEVLPALQAFQAGRAGDAETALRQRLEEGDDPAARVTLAILLNGRKHYDEAEGQLAAAITAETETDLEIHARQHLARLCLMRGREGDAARQLRAAAQLGALDRDLALWLVPIELAADRESAAKDLLRSVIRNHQSVQALLALAELAPTEEGPESAPALLGQAQGLAPNCEEVLALSGRSWLAAGRSQLALGALEPLQRMHPTVAEYADLLRRACGRLEDLEGAKRYRASCERALGKAGGGRDSQV